MPRSRTQSTEDGGNPLKKKRGAKGPNRTSFKPGHRPVNAFELGNHVHSGKDLYARVLGIVRREADPAKLAQVILDKIDRAGDSRADYQDVFALLIEPYLKADLLDPHPAQATYSPERERLRVDLGAFAKTVCPHLVPGDWSSMHRDWIAEHRARFGERGVKTVCAAPRGHGKTTMRVVIAVLHAICFHLEKYILVIGATEPLAVDMVRSIGRELEGNEQMKAMFGDLVGQERWLMGAGDLTTSTGIRIRAASTGQAIRGTRHDGIRPTAIFGDDMEHPNHVESADARAKLKEQWWEKTILPLGDHETNIHVSGTLLHPQSLLADLLANPAYHTSRYSAILPDGRGDYHWASNHALWQQWKALYVDLANPQRIEDARAFFAQHRDAMREGAQVLWPEVIGYEQLMEKVLVLGETAFAQEFLLDPLAGGDFAFHLQAVRYVTLEPGGIRTATRVVPNVDIVRKLCFIDPSTGTASGDWTAAVALFKDRNGWVYAVDAVMSREPVDIVQGRIVDMCYRLGIDTCGLEAVGFQWEAFKPGLATAVAAKALVERVDWGLTFIPVHPSGNKEARIATTLQPALANGYVQLSSELPAELMTQLRLFKARPGANDHDDGPDALAQGYALVSS